MIFEPKTFFQTYLKDYHKTKATYLKGMLDNLSKVEKTYFGKKLTDEGRDTIRRTIKSDLRQTYFHAIETFFELFFAFNPQGKKVYDDEFVLFKLTNSNWKDTYNKIKKIAENGSELNFLNEKVKFMNYEISVGHYLFYMGIFDNGKFPKELFVDIDESIEAIKYGVKIIAEDFIKREEYNAYKHGLRIIPATSKLIFADAKTMEAIIEWDLTDSMSFYAKTKSDDELKVVTKLFDPERDYQMTLFCSNLIHHLVYYRRVALKFAKDVEKNDPVLITTFGKEPIDKCNKVNVQVQDLVHSIKKV